MRNMFSHSVKFALATVFLAGAGVTMAGAPDSVESCTSCHGKDGISDDSTVPIIAGASDYFLENQLAIFAAEARPCADSYFEEEAEEGVDGAENHCALAESMSEDEQVEAAGYYASKPFSPAEQEVDEELASQGASIHEAKCDRCHTDAGTLALDDAGILAGQWKHYLMHQFKYYRDEERWQPEKMAPEMADLSDEDMKALAEYYASEGPKRFD